MANIDQIGAYFVPTPQRQAKPAAEFEFKFESPVVHIPSGNVGAAAPKASKPEPVTPPKRLSLAEITKLLSKVNLHTDLFEISANYSIDEASGGIQVEVKNTKTGEVIRRIPPYDAVLLLLDREKAAGLLLDQKV